MSYSSYEAKENTPEGFRGLVVTMCEQGSGRVDFVTADDERHVIGLDDLAFLVRAAASLPQHVLGINEVRSGGPVTHEPEKAKVPAAVKPKTAGRRWCDEEEARLRDLYKAGNEIGQIADVLERSPAAIVSRLLVMDLIEVKPKH